MGHQFAIVMLLILHSTVFPAQETGLTVRSAAPQGDVSQIGDAQEIRLTFSEPMVALGTPVDVLPSWLRITPAITAAAYWSGTRTLVVSASPDSPLAFGSRYTVEIAPDATSLAGNRLGRAFAFAFTTPTVRLLGADWYRVEGQVQRPVVIRLRFNQPVDPAVVLAHAQVRHHPHSWDQPGLSSADRERWRQEDPANLERFDAKVQEVRRVTLSSEAVRVRLADAWDERRFPRDPATVVLTTTDAPSAGAWLNITLDGQLVGREGVVPHPEQTSVIRLEQPLFVMSLRCAPRCAPGYWTAISLSRGVTADAAATALRVHDISAAVPVEVPRGSRPRDSWQPPEGMTYLSPDQLGFPPPPPMAVWQVSLDDDLQSVDGQRLGYRWSSTFNTTNYPSHLDWSGVIWESGGGSTVPFYTRNVTAITTRTERMTLTDVIPRLFSFDQPGAFREPATRGVERTFPPRANIFQAPGLDLSPWLNPHGNGLVWASLAPLVDLPDTVNPDPDSRYRPTLLQVTNLAISVKDSPVNTLIMVTTLDRAEPVAGATVTLRDISNTPFWRGTTNTHGIVIAPGTQERAARNPYLLSFVATAETANDASWVASNWRAGSAYPPDTLNSTAPILRGSVISDRGAYLPGEEVRLKAILRWDTATGHELVPAGTTFDVIVRDARDAEVARAPVKANRWSSLEWRWAIPTGGSLGRYHVEIRPPNTPDSSQRWQETVGTSWLVAQFRRPEFQVRVTATSQPAIVGQSVTGTIEAAFLFGAPVGAQPVRLMVRRYPHVDVPRAIHERFPAGQFVFGAPERGRATQVNDEVRNERTQLGPDGRLQISVPIPRVDDAAEHITIEAEVEGVSGQHIANRTSLTMHPASLYVGFSRPSFLVDAGKGLSTNVVAVNLDGTVRPQVPVVVSLVRVGWLDNNVTLTEVGSWKTTSQAAPVPVAVTVPGAGRYLLRTTAQDEAGRTTHSEYAFYAYGAGQVQWQLPGTSGLVLVPERETWKPGETARILVQSPWDRAEALVTTEREGVRTHQRVAITSTQDTITIPITERDIPNVFVSVLLFKGRTSEVLAPGGEDIGRPDVRTGTVELQVDDTTKRLVVDVRAARTEYRPRETVRVSVGVRDQRGQGRRSEVTLWAVDEGLLSLTEYALPDVARAIYAQKRNQVYTIDSRQHLIDRRSVDAARSVPQSNPIGRSFTRSVHAAAAVSLTESIMVQEAVAEGDVRSDFKPLAFWVGSLETNNSGMATTSVTLPDSVTAYRIMAVTGDLTSHFGSGAAEIRTSLPLTLLPAFPRFLSLGDRASFGVTVTNNTADAGDAVVTITNADGTFVGFEGATTQTVRLAPGASQAVRFDARALGVGAARLRVAVRLGADRDAIEWPLDVTSPARLETVAAYGETVSRATERLLVPAGVTPRAGGLTLSLASTALVGLGESARFLETYEYDCAEPLASKAITLLLSASLDGVFTGGGASVTTAREAGLKALSELASFQCGDGGIGMFRSSCRSSAYLTAYVLHVMKIAQGLGAPIDPVMTQRALNHLQEQLGAPPPEVQWWPAWASTRAYALKVLAEWGHPQIEAMNSLHNDAERLPVFALSYLADAYTAANETGSRYQDTVRRIGNAIRIDADRAFVEEVDEVALIWLWHSNVRATAVVLDGLARRGGADAALAAPLARWLLAARVNGRWGTTHENGVALNALVTYQRALETDVPDMTVTTAVGGSRVGRTQFKGRSTDAREVHVPMRDLAIGGSADLTIDRTGTGRLFYTTRLQYLPTTPPVPLARGLRLSRRFARIGADGTSVDAVTFARGDLVRVTIRLDLSHEGRFLAITDPLAAGLEPIDGGLKTTMSIDAREATTQSSDTSWMEWWRRGGFDHIEKHHDRVAVFATRLSAGRHEISYLARAMTSGTFDAAGTWGEAMYAPEITGRAVAQTIVVK